MTGPQDRAADAGAPFRLGHRPCLDGVRGLAILLVLVAHIPKLPLLGGFIGVDVFFVLSGFLITSLLLEEWRSTGGISLKDFYARRALRLIPALVVMLAAAVAFSGLVEEAGSAAQMRRAALMTLLYSANWFMAYDAYPRRELSPSWSLSVEEQFYILWPVLLLLVLRARLSPRARAWLIAAGIIASAAARAALWWKTKSLARVYFGTDTHADGLLVGALVALAADAGWVPRSGLGARVLNWLAHAVVVFLLLFAKEGWTGDPGLYTGRYLLLNLSIGGLVMCLVGAPWRSLLAIFEFAPLVWIGRVSYGIYLWHMVVFTMLGQLHWVRGDWYWEAALALTISITALSFYVMERPILRLKRRFERVPAAGTGA